MTLSLVLSDELETRLRDEAARRGLDPAEYARSLLEECLAPAEPADVAKEPTRPFHETATTEEWLREFDKTTAEFEDIDAPDLSDDALRRENIYEDRGL